jgi:cytosine/adenosine deaminase-related metal-dependent hydrolase
MGYLRMLSKASRALIIHGNYLGEDEIAFLGRSRAHMSVVYCPRTHGYFRHDPYPLAALRSAGAHVVLGTDSRASNPDLSIVRELNRVAELHRGVPRDELLRMATLGAAESLGVASEVGSLSPGKRADLAAFPCGSDLADPYDFLHAPAEAPMRVWVAGCEVDMTPQHTQDAS